MILRIVAFAQDRHVLLFGQVCHGRRHPGAAERVGQQCGGSHRNRLPILYSVCV